RLEENFLAAAEPDEYQSIDEQGQISWSCDYMNRFEVYQDASGDRAVIGNFGACADVVLRLNSDLAHRNHKLFFDNLFCPIPLIEELKQSLKSDKDMKLTKWMDYNAVHVASSYAGNKSQNCIQRWYRSSPTMIQINRPLAVGFYNKNMGGIDLLDQLLALYPSRKRNKWW
ncbi:hypothetical protein ILUMI_06256, partial [Ignelater luminosus]